MGFVGRSLYLNTGSRTRLPLLSTLYHSVVSGQAEVKYHGKYRTGNVKQNLVSDVVSGAGRVTGCQQLQM